MTPLDEEQAYPALQDPEAKWYVIHTYSGYENRVKTNLESRIESMDARDKIFRVEVPTEEQVEMHRGQRRQVQRKVFPGYVLVQMKLDPSSEYVVRNTPGVTDFVGTGDLPTPLEEGEVRQILRQAEQPQQRVKITFQKGQRVKVIDGPFTDFIGVVDEINTEKNKVTVLISMFGRDTPVDLDLLQVERL
ncbi:MAG: transcription termination/antitermination protein NusG [Chloroflexi bacterium]|nr:transcription termination/antitermination protein NusG [Chloroflexota bacterium]